MKVLLDTGTFLWVVQGAPELSAEARRIFEDPDNDVYLSAVSSWEIAIKSSLGRLPLPEPADVYIPKVRLQHAIDSLPLDEEAILHLARLPAMHKDPFDRALVCQALIGGLSLLTPDSDIRQYPVRTVW